MKSVRIRFLSQEDILSLNLTSTQIVSALERMLVSHGKKLVQMPPKPAIFPREGRKYDYMHAMPAYASDLDVCGLKWLSRSSENERDRDLPQFTGLQVMNDPDSGVPLAVMDCRWITVARTTAVSVLTARLCSPRAPKVMGLLGTGLQGRFHALMLAQELPTVKEIRVYNRTESKRDEFIRQIAPRLPGVKLVPATMEEAIRDCDVVAAVGPGGHGIHLDWIAPGSLFISINLAQPLAPDAVAGVERIFTDDAKQFWNRFETEPDAFGGKPEVDGELSELVLGKKQPRIAPSDRVLSLNLGMAISDLALGDLIYREAEARNVGTVLPLMEQEDLWPVIG